MDQKDLRRLSRRDLLEMLLDLAKENDLLKEVNKQLEAALEDRTLETLEAGSLAEASLRLNGVFQAAQNAADQYLFNMQQHCRQMEEETKIRCEQMLRDAQNRVMDYEQNT